MAALVATVVIAEKEDPEEEDTLEAEDIQEVVVEVAHTVKDGAMTIVVVMA